MDVKQFILLGPPGVELDSHANNLADRFHISNFSMEQLVGEAIASKSTIGLEIQPYIEAEERVPDVLTMKLLRKRLEQPDAILNGWVLAGFPCTLAQAQALNEWLSTMGQPLATVIYLKSMTGLLVNRLWSKQGQTGSTEPIRRHVEKYLKDIAPLLDYYRQQDQLKTINATLSFSEISSDLVQFGYQDSAGAAPMIKNEAELDVLLAEESLLVVDCMAAWCGSCKEVTPLIDQLANAYGDRAHVMKIDFDANQQIPKRFGLKGMPAVMFFKDGKLQETLTGVKSYQTYSTVLTRFLD